MDYLVPSVVRDGALVPRAGQLDTVEPDSRDEIDVLVVYTSAAKRAVGGDMDASLERVMRATHEAYEQSAITTRLRLVHAYEDPSYEDTADAMLHYSLLSTPG